MKSRILALASAGILAVAMPLSADAQKPAYGSWGFDVAGMDRTVKPGDNFFDYANGNWVKTLVMPADKAVWGVFRLLADRSEQRTYELLDAIAASRAAKGTNAQKIGDLYRSFMDEDGIERAGAQPLKPYLARIDAIHSRAELAEAFAEANRTGVGAPIAVLIQQDTKNRSRYAVYLGQSGLGLPDRDYYLEAKFEPLRATYIEHVTNMLRLAGISEPQARAGRVFELEKQIAQIQWSRVQRRQTDKLYNPRSVAELAQLAPGFDWTAYLKGAGLADQTRVIVAEPSAIEGTAKIVAATPIDTWKDYLTIRTIRAAAPLLPKAFVDENFAFAKVLTGTPQLPDRWNRGVGVVNGALGEAVGQAYVARAFTPQSKAKADALVHNLIRAMDARLTNLSWMAPATKAKARAKLAALTPKIGYPDKWRDYSALDIEPGDLVGNVFRSRAFDYARNVRKLRTPFDRGEWSMFPQTVNAYADPAKNDLVFPAAILQPPLFDPGADDAVNYGAIGAIIGHELSHLFDEHGRKFDKSGEPAEWWTPADIAAFNTLADRLGAQYSGYEVLPGQHVNGALTMDENIADMAGLAVAYDAYHLSLNSKAAPAVDGYTGDQRFFLGYAQASRTRYGDGMLQLLLVTDPHSPSTVRPFVVRNFDAWYKAFNVQPGEKLYLPPEARVHIW